MTSATKLDVHAAATHLKSSDPVMRKLIDRIGDCELRPGSRGDHFTTLVRAIVGQQLSAKAAETIFQRLAALAAKPKKIKPEEIAALPDEVLRGCGLSKAKTTYIRDLAEHVLDGRVKLTSLGRRPDDEIVAELVRVKGIGRWTVEMFMLFKLGRPDIWAIDDLGLRNAVRNLYGIEPARPALMEVAEPWRPWRSVASWYLWRSLAPAAPSLANETKLPV